MLVGDANLEPSSVPTVDRRHSGTDGLPPTPEQAHADGGRGGPTLLGPVTTLPASPPLLSEC